ncbi:MAG: hypothetical protein NTV32_04460 [Gammaproteobacteria bacterium]|jgi:hypothetical protein|nr:hypothetical protein [Gammaproteobacteria bacterium]
MPPSPSPTPEPSESGYILILCMIFVILISLAFASFMQTLEHYQRLNTEFKMNAQILALEPSLMAEALQETETQNNNLHDPTPSPIPSPNMKTQKNEMHLRAILTIDGKKINIWQAWFFIHDPSLPITPLFEAKIRCPAETNACQIIHWHRALEG